MKQFFKFIVCLAGTFVGLIVVLWLCISYETTYRKTICDIAISPDGAYELILQAVGAPDWPFGSARGRLILKEGKSRIARADFELHNDGGSINSDCWKVTWHEDYVEVILSGKEQADEQIWMRFDGKTERFYESE